MKQEQQLILKLIDYINPDRDGINELLQANLDWAYILGHLNYNRVAGLAYYTLLQCKADFGAINREFVMGVYMVFEAQRERTRAYKRIVDEVATIFNEAGISHAFLKGSILSSTIYPEGCRISNDIDILVNANTLTACSRALNQHGFIQGFYDRHTETIRPASRLEIVNSRMNYGEVIPYQRIVNQIGLNYIKIDLNFSLNWLPIGTEQAVENFLNNITFNQVLENDQVKSLKLEYFLAHLCMHLYKELHLIEMIRARGDLNLYKFVDIYALIEKEKAELDWEAFVKLVIDNQMTKECYLALQYTKELYPSLAEIAELQTTLQKLEPGNLGYFDEVIDPTTNQKFVWKKDFTSRLFDMNRAESLASVE